MIRVVHVYLVAQHMIAQERTLSLCSSNLFQRGMLRLRHRAEDTRIHRSARLLMVYVILAMRAESPQILAAAIAAMSAVLVMGILYAIEVLD